MAHLLSNKRLFQNHEFAECLASFNSINNYPII